MSLLSDLKTAKTEEDVKDAYVKALGLKQFSKNLVDIQTKEIWFEAKEAGTSPVAMFISVTVHLIIAVFGSNITDAIIKCTVTEIRKLQAHSPGRTGFCSLHTLARASASMRVTSVAAARMDLSFVNMMGFSVLTADCEAMIYHINFR